MTSPPRPHTSTHAPGPSVRVVVLANRRARGLSTSSASGSNALLDVLRSRRAGVNVVETCSVTELEVAAKEIARAIPEAIVLAGGDGSHMAGASALVRAFASEGLSVDALPPIALVPGGTVNTVARNWGFRGAFLEGGTAAYTARLLDAVASQRATVTRRPTLRCEDDSASRIGFIVGAGLVSRFFETYNAQGAGGHGHAASLMLRVFAGCFTNGALAKHVLAPMPCVITVDSVRAPFVRTSLVCASVVRNLGLGIRLLYRAAEEEQRFHVVATPLRASKLGPQLPLVLAGRGLLGSDTIDKIATHVTLGFGDKSAYVLDGELLLTRSLRVTAGPVLRILSC